MNVSIATCSAALLYPVPDSSDPPLPTTHLPPGTMASQALGPPLFNYKALQLWILRWVLGAPPVPTLCSCSAFIARAVSSLSFI